MKLSDIFNVNLNTGGGNKLFARIMNKYNVPKKEYKDIRKDLKEQSESSSSGSSSKYAPRYFNIDFSIADEGWKYLLTIENVSDISTVENVCITIGSTYKLIIVDDNTIDITSYPFISLDGNIKFYFSYIPLYFDEGIAESFNLNKYGFLEFEDIIEIMPSLIKMIFGKDITLSINGITEITEEEYYKID